jgi:Phage portal protein, SPP1 Gp6-like.
MWQWHSSWADRYQSRWKFTGNISRISKRMAG